MGNCTKKGQVDGGHVSLSVTSFGGGHESVENSSMGAEALRSLAEKHMEKRVSGTPGARE